MKQTMTRKEITAIHEAGHAAVMLAFGYTPERMVLEDEGTGFGAVHLPGTPALGVG